MTGVGQGMTPDRPQSTNAEDAAEGAAGQAGLGAGLIGLVRPTTLDQARSSPQARCDVPRRGSGADGDAGGSRVSTALA